MITSKAGIELIKQFEGLRTVAYVCPAGVRTIGYGHTKNVKLGQKCSPEQAEKWLKSDLIEFETEVTAWNYLYRWTQHEFDALVSFAFNCGNASLRNLLKNGTRTRAQIRTAILLYNKDINGHYLQGLANRRKAELKLFNTPDEYEDEITQNEYETVEDIVKGIWAGDFGTPWSKSDKLYKYFLKKVNEYKRG